MCVLCGVSDMTGPWMKGKYHVNLAELLSTHQISTSTNDCAHQTNILLTCLWSCGLELSHFVWQHHCRSTSYSICISFHHSSRMRSTTTIIIIVLDTYEFCGKFSLSNQIRNAMREIFVGSILFLTYFSLSLSSLSIIFTQVLNLYLPRI